MTWSQQQLHYSPTPSLAVPGVLSGLLCLQIFSPQR